MELWHFKTTNHAVNRNLASLIKNWNDIPKCFYELVSSYIYLHYQCDLLTWVINMI